MSDKVVPIPGANDSGDGIKLMEISPGVYAFAVAVVSGSTGGGTVDASAGLAKQLIDEVSASLTYICEAPLGTATSAPAWRIKRVQKSGTVTLIQYAGTGVFDQVADQRAAIAAWV